MWNPLVGYDGGSTAQASVICPLVRCCFQCLPFSSRCSASFSLPLLVFLLMGSAGDSSSFVFCSQAAPGFSPLGVFFPLSRLLSVPLLSECFFSLCTQWLLIDLLGCVFSVYVSFLWPCVRLVCYLVSLPSTQYSLCFFLQTCYFFPLLVAPGSHVFLYMCPFNWPWVWLVTCSPRTLFPLIFLLLWSLASMFFPGCLPALPFVWFSCACKHGVFVRV